jgi:hypothetical protein
VSLLKIQLIIIMYEAYNDNLRASFRHHITGSVTTQRPREAVGGIIADDMGLGKTLSVLATVVNSLGRATTFASSTAAPEDATGALYRPQKAVKATLVIVPSLCESVITCHRSAAELTNMMPYSTSTRLATTNKRVYGRMRQR